jgi:hypothetical protein
MYRRTGGKMGGAVQGGEILLLTTKGVDPAGHTRTR